MRAVTIARRSLSGLALAAGLLLAPPGHAQDARAGGAAAQPAGSIAEGIPVRREPQGGTAGPSGESWWIAVVMAGGLLALAFVIARRRATGPSRAAGGAWWTRFGGFLDAVPSHEIQRVSSMPLSQRHSLHVVVWNGRRLLLGCTEQSIQLLAETAATAGSPEPASAPAPAAPGETR